MLTVLIASAADWLTPPDQLHVRHEEHERDIEADAGDDVEKPDAKNRSPFEPQRLPDRRAALRVSRGLVDLRNVLANVEAGEADSQPDEKRDAPAPAVDRFLG
jgi:hypothetical protein